MKTTREIKFRAWDGHSIIKSDDWPNLGGFFGTRSPDEILMQYTGLKDKNGKEIYEGDIVKVGEDKTYVEFEEGAFWFCFNQKNRFTADWIREQSEKYEINPDTYEIIGNIYENPELLS